MNASPALQPLPNADTHRGEEKKPAKLVFLDCETTGLDPTRHEVYELGLIVEGTDGVEEAKHWWFEIDLKRADSEALRMSGFYERYPAQDPNRDPNLLAEPLDIYPAAEAAPAIARMTAGAHLVGVNPAFDATFLGALLRSAGQVPAWEYHLVDVLPLVAGRMRMRPPWSSRELSAEIGVEPPGLEDRHTALGDARWAKRMYDAVMFGG